MVLLLPFSWVYALAVAIRNALYDAGLLPVRKVGRPVVSVGNLTAGGTGKTPMVSYLVERAEAAGMRPAVVGRGYRRRSRGTVVVADGTHPVAPGAAEAGDELYLLACRHPRAVVIADERRARGAAAAVDRFGADIVILDDGFQHRALARDFDIVMLDTSRTLPALLPAGLRREPLGALRRASLVVAANAATADDGAWTARYTPAPRACVRTVALGVRAIGQEALRPVAEFAGRRCLAVCGIGNPEAFRTTAREAGFEVTGLEAFRDHVWYGRRERRRVEAAFARSGAELVLTTEKDAVKLAPADWAGFPLYVLAAGLAVLSGREHLERIIGEVAAR